MSVPSLWRAGAGSHRHNGAVVSNRETGDRNGQARCPILLAWGRRRRHTHRWVNDRGFGVEKRFRGHCGRPTSGAGARLSPGRALRYRRSASPLGLTGGLALAFALTGAGLRRAFCGFASRPAAFPTLGLPGCTVAVCRRPYPAGRHGLALGFPRGSALRARALRRFLHGLALCRHDRMRR